MLKFPQNAELRTWFGDFGGDVCVNDTDLALKEDFASEVNSVLADAAFEGAFHEALDVVLRSINTASRTIETKNNRTIELVPNLGIWYNMAGQLAIAKLLGRKRIFAGSKCKKAVRILAESCQALGFSLSLFLGRELCGDAELKEALGATGADLDAKTCAGLLDLPEAYIAAPFSRPVDGWMLPLTANYAPAPRPAIVGILSGLYGEELRRRLPAPDCVAAMMSDGTGALGVLKAYIDTDTPLYTVEDLIAQEYHILDHNCYTISVRSSKSQDMPLSLCPELVNLWRRGRVVRLGSDRIIPVDTTALEEQDLSAAAARAAALVMEATEAKHIVLVED